MTALHTLLQQAEGERDRALALLQQAEERLRQLQLQAQQLEAYRREYQQRWSGQFARRGTMEIVHCYQSFSQRLDEALAQQQQHSEAAQAQAERARQQLLAAELRVASVGKLIERRVAEQRRVEDRRDQRQTDETAQVRWRAQRTETPH